MNPQSAAAGEDALRTRIGQLLRDGLRTQTEPQPATEREFSRLLDALRALPRDDLAGRLALAGFVDQPRGPDRLRCLECIYYLVNRQWCDLPELSLPVEPDWWCRLWRI